MKIAPLIEILSLNLMLVKAQRALDTPFAEKVDGVPPGKSAKGTKSGKGAGGKGEKSFRPPAKSGKAKSTKSDVDGPTGSHNIFAKSKSKKGGGADDVDPKAEKVGGKSGKGSKSGDGVEDEGQESYNPFNKSGKSAKVGEGEGAWSKGDESYKPFAKSGKSKGTKVDDANGTAPTKIFAKSKKGKYSKGGKTTGASEGFFHKAGKSKGGKTSATLFHKAGKSKAQKEASYHHASEDLTGTVAKGTKAPSAELNGEAPTLRPTCSDAPPEDFDVCIAIDGSGSVCNGGFGGECWECSIFCQEGGFDQGTCCGNFATIKEFASLMVGSLNELPAEKSFSVVQFSTTARVENGPSTSEATSTVLEEMDYMGGSTSHEGAIQACLDTLRSSSNSTGGRQFVLLITDGVSTWPEDDPEGAAEAAAAEAKEDDVSIIPVFISKEYNEDALTFMRRLSSDGRVFDVTDFESLNSLQGSLVDEVSCLV